MQVVITSTPAFFVVILSRSVNYAPATMKYFVLEKTKYILNNSWIGYLIPAGVHQLLNFAEKINGFCRQTLYLSQISPRRNKNFENDRQ